MMTCKEYIFKLTSGQLEQAGTVERLWAAQHRLMCRPCKAFTANDERLSHVLSGYQQHMTTKNDEQER